MIVGTNESTINAYFDLTLNLIDFVTIPLLLRHTNSSIKITNQYESHSCLVGHTFSAALGYWKGLWLLFDCTTFNLLWLGARGYSGLGHPQ